MKICILQVLHEPFDKRVFHKEAKSLVAAGHEILSIAPSDGPVPDTDGITFRTIPVAQGLPARARSAWRLVREGLHVETDCYFAVEPESWVAALVLKLLRRKKVVFDVHEPIPPEFAKFFPKPLRPFAHWATVCAMRIFARFTDHIILTRESLAAEFKGLKVPQSIVINTNHLQPMCTDIPEALRERYAARPTIIHQGVFGDVRGSYELLEALKIAVQDLPDLKCILLGRYVYGDEEAYKKAAREAGLEDVVDMPGVVPFEAVPAYIAVSRIGLILLQPALEGLKYAMPHKLFDYMRESIPCIVPDFTIEVRRIVEEADCGLVVDVTKPQAIAEAIVGLLRNSDEAQRLGANGRRAVETKYHWANDERVLLDAFASVERGR